MGVLNRNYGRTGIKKKILEESEEWRRLVITKKQGIKGPDKASKPKERMLQQLREVDVKTCRTL